MTVDGKPLAGAVVIFMPCFSVGTHSVGETDADGNFEMTHMGRPGVGRGDYRVVVSYIVGKNGKVADLAAHSSDRVPAEINDGVELIPRRYSSYSQTELRAIVPPTDATATFNFDLKGPLFGPRVKAQLAGPPP